MENCCRAYVYKPKKIRKKRSVIVKVSIIICSLLLSFILYYFCVVAPVVYTIIDSKLQMLFSNAVDDSASNYLDDMVYDDYIIIRTDSDGNVTYFGINSVGINALARNVTDSIRDEIEKFEQTGIDVQLGMFSGVTFLANFGPIITMNVMALAVVNATFESTFTDSGYNQTLHRMYLNVEIEGNIILPGYSKSIVNSSSILVNEMVVVGQTPDTVIDI